jgi:hypothetical protein
MWQYVPELVEEFHAFAITLSPPAFIPLPISFFEKLGRKVGSNYRPFLATFLGVSDAGSMSFRIGVKVAL